MNFNEESRSNYIVMTRRQLFTIMKEQKTDINQKFKYLENHLLNLDKFSEELVKEIKHHFSHFKHDMKSRWTKAHRKEKDFVEQNSKWLDGTFLVPKVSYRPGQPTKEFNSLSERNKRRKTEDLHKSTDLETLTHATQMKLGECRKRDAYLVLKQITSSPKRATRYKKSFSKQEKSTTTSQLDPLTALSIFVEAGLSRNQYEIIRSDNKMIYPCYSILQKTKQECYPDKEAYLVTETCAEIKLQSLMDLTVSRLLKYLNEVLLLLKEEERGALVLMCKWGCDAAQQAQYKQTFENDSDSDANLFQSSFVPLRLICSTNNKIIWQNPTPSSPRYCRPIRMRFIKETKDVTNEEINYIKNATNALYPTTVTMADKIYSVKYTMMHTMIDGKVCNAAINTTSTIKCYICGITSKDFNNLAITKEVNPETLNFGISILHARIRFFESILHLSYKLPVKKWQLRSEADKAAVKRRKLQVQNEFREKMGLIVDVPIPGFGNTNDGNTSRRFFADHELAAEITGIDVGLIYRLKVILETLSSGYAIDVELFSAYTKESAELYVALYPWHPMTLTLHKILIHGPVVVENALLSIGMLSKEATKARNKHFRQYSQDFARKFDRVSCNMDVLNSLLLSSDPLITGMRPMPRKKSNAFLKETRAMLRAVAQDFATVSDDMETFSDEDNITSDEELWNSSSD